MTHAELAQLLDELVEGFDVLDDWTIGEFLTEASVAADEGSEAAAKLFQPEPFVLEEEGIESPYIEETLSFFGLTLNHSVINDLIPAVKHEAEMQT